MRRLVSAGGKRRDEIRMGVAGCGRIATLVHLSALRELSGVRIAALAETDPARRETAAGVFPEAETFGDFGEMVRDADLDALVVCLPPALHAQAAVAAFGAGHHVYLEKPIATSAEEATEIVEAWRGAGTVGMIGFNYRFHPACRAAGEALRAGRIGEPVAVRTVFSAAARPLPAWKRTRDSGGGVLLDLGSHHVDLVPFLLGRSVRAVSASIRSRASEADTASLTLELERGIPVQSSFCFGTVDEDRIEIHGTEGALRLDRYRGRVDVTPPAFEYGRWSRARHAFKELARGLGEALRPPGDPSYRLALAAFAEAARRGEGGEPGLDAGHRALGVALAAEEAARSGRTVAVRPDEGATGPTRAASDRPARPHGAER